MKITINEFCWTTSLRSGCLLVAWILVVFYGLFVVSIPFQQEKKPAEKENDVEKWFWRKYGRAISCETAIMFILVALVIFVGVCKKSAIAMLVSVIGFSIQMLIFVVLVIWAAISGSYMLPITFIIFMGIHGYFLLALESYRQELKNNRQPDEETERG